jgi:hypothetical protein
VTEDPGLNPRSPNIVVGPVLVTVEPPNTEKLAADPKPTVAVAPRALLAKIKVDSNPSKRSPARNLLWPVRKKGRRLTARESFVGDSHVGGTPLFIGVSSLRHRAPR